MVGWYHSVSMSPASPVSAVAARLASCRLPCRFPRETALTEGRLVRRYKRFLADVELASGETVTAHCANTGAMEGMTAPGARVWVSHTDDPKRKLSWTWELVEAERPVPGGDGETAPAVFGAHTSAPNRLVRRLLEERRLGWLGEWEEMKPEKRYGENSRIDFWLEGSWGETYVEVKNCHLVYPDGRAYFPDAVSKRAAKHLAELEAVAAEGHRAEVLFVAQTGPIEALRPSDAHDPDFAAAARRAAAAGVGFSALAVSHTPEEIVVEGLVPVDLEPYDLDRVSRWREAARRG